MNISGAADSGILYIWNLSPYGLILHTAMILVYVDADMAKKGVDCVKIIQSFYAMMEDMIEKIYYINRKK